MRVTLAFSQTVDKRFLVLANVGGSDYLDPRINFATAMFEHEDAFIGLVISIGLSEEDMRNVVIAVLLSVSQPVYPQRWVDLELTEKQAETLGLRGTGTGKSYGYRDTSRHAPEATIALGLIFDPDQLAEFLEDAPTPFAVFGGSKHVVKFANPPYVQIMGFHHRREVIGLPIREIFPEMEGQPFFDLLDGVFRTGEPFIGTEVLAKMRTSESAELQDFYFDLIYYPVRDSAGEVAGIMVQASDVTGKVMARLESEHREELLFTQWAELDAIYRASPVGMALLDVHDFKVLRINQKQAELMGGSIESLLGKSALKTSAKIPEFVELLQQVVKEKSIITTIVRERPQGVAIEGRSWLVNLRPAMGVKAEITTVSSVFLEMPVHSWPEKVAESPDHQVVDVLETITDGLFVMDRSWNFIYLNSLARATLVDGENMLGRNMWEQFPAARDLPFWDAYHLTMEESVPTHFEVFYPEPLHRWFDIRAFPARDGMSVFFRDITEAKREKAARRESEERYRTLMDLSPQVPWTMSPTGAITDFGGRWEEMTGLSREETLGRGFMTVVHPEDAERLVEMLERALSMNAPFDISWRIRRLTGGYSWVRSRGVPVLAANGNALKYYGTTEDIDELTQLRQKMASRIASPGQERAANSPVSERLPKLHQFPGAV